MPVRGREASFSPAQSALGSASAAPDRSVGATWIVGPAWLKGRFAFEPQNKVRLSAVAKLTGVINFFGCEKSPPPAGSVSIEAIWSTPSVLALPDLSLRNSTRSGSELTL